MGCSEFGKIIILMHTLYIKKINSGLSRWLTCCQCLSGNEALLEHQSRPEVENQAFLRPSISKMLKAYSGQFNVWLSKKENNGQNCLYSLKLEY